MYSDLLKIVHALVLECDLPAKTLAEKLGKPYSTLLREINPHDRGAKLGAETLLQLMQLTRSAAPLHYMADLLGYELVAKRNGQNASGTSAGKETA